MIGPAEFAELEAERAEALALEAATSALLEALDADAGDEARYHFLAATHDEADDHVIARPPFG